MLYYLSLNSKTRGRKDQIDDLQLRCAQSEEPGIIMNEIIVAIIALGVGARYAEKIREVAPITDPNHKQPAAPEATT